MRIAHVSDLHLGRDPVTDRAAHLLARALEEAGPLITFVTGDVTHRGLLSELARFEAIFRRPLDAGRMVVVPGNHDRLADDVRRSIMPRGRVDVVERPGLHIVRLDSTGPHNRSVVDSHGLLTAADVEAVEAAMATAAPGALAVLLLHHHLLPLPPDHLGERLSNLLGWPNAAELRLGGRLLERLRGRCDLVLHGHRHAPSERVLDADGPRPLRVLNAGSTTGLRRLRLLSARGDRVTGLEWLGFGEALPALGGGAPDRAVA
ncbi:MAG: metallophosphoesterase [Anaeromyxobacter sp.]